MMHVCSISIRPAGGVYPSLENRFVVLTQSGIDPYEGGTKLINKTFQLKLHPEQICELRELLHLHPHLLALDDVKKQEPPPPVPRDPNLEMRVQVVQKQLKRVAASPSAGKPGLEGQAPLGAGAAGANSICILCGGNEAACGGYKFPSWSCKGEPAKKRNCQRTPCTLDHISSGSRGTACSDGYIAKSAPGGHAYHAAAQKKLAGQ